MLKKTIRRLGALAMVLAMAVSVFAVNASATGEGEEAAAAVTLPKNYTITNGGTVKPDEALSMTLTKKNATDLREGSSWTATDFPVITLSKAKGTDAFVIGNLSALNDIGLFHYEFTENNAGTAGVEYYAGTVYVDVLCSYKTDGSIQQEVVVYTKNDKSDKVESITNIFKAGTLTVEKEVTGRMGDKSKTFNVKVSFATTEGKVVRNDITYVDIKGVTQTISAGDGWTTKDVTIQVKHGTKIEFKNVPYDVNYTVLEDPYEGYTTSYESETKVKKEGGTTVDTGSGTVDSATESVKVINDKDVSTPGGVIMTIAPYALMVVLAGAFAVVFLTRRNRAE